MTYFKTTGKVLTRYNQDDSIKGYHVGREDAGDVFVATLIEEYTQIGKFVHIDKWGRAWVKAESRA